MMFMMDLLKSEQLLIVHFANLSLGCDCTPTCDVTSGADNT